MARHFFEAHGLRFSSELACLAVPRTDSTTCEVEISLGEVEPLIASHCHGVRWAARRGALYYQVDHVARYGVTDGSKITVCRQNGAADSDVEAFLFGTAMAALLQQRCRLTLHASSVVVNDRVVLICGDSGAGKSTLTARIALQGNPVFADDLTSLALAEAAPVAFSAFPGLSLHLDAIKRFGQGVSVGEPVRPGIAKYRVLQECFRAGALPVSHVFFLATTNETKASLAALGIVDAVECILGHIYRPKFPQALQVQEELLKCVVSLATQCLSYKAFRPHGASEENLAEAVLSMIL